MEIAHCLNLVVDEQAKVGKAVCVFQEGLKALVPNINWVVVDQISIDDKSSNRRIIVSRECHLRDNSVGKWAATFQCPVEVRIGISVCSYKFTLGGYSFEFKGVVGGCISKSV